MQAKITSHAQKKYIFSFLFMKFVEKFPYYIVNPGQFLESTSDMSNRNHLDFTYVKSVNFIQIGKRTSLINLQKFLSINY